MRKTDDDYDWTADAIASYKLAIETFRERYLEDRLPGEKAKEWLKRTGYNLIGADVSDIYVNGKPIVQDREVVTINRAEMNREAQHRAEAIWARAEKNF